MSSFFWSQYNSLSLKRNWRYLGYFNFYNRGIPGDLRVTPGQEPVVVGAVASQQYTIQPFLIHSFDKPSMETNVTDYGGQNTLNGSYDYAIQNINWKSISIDIYDTYSLTANSEEGANATKLFFDWFKRLGYDADSMAGKVTQAGSKIPEYIANLNEENSIYLKIAVIDEFNREVESFSYKSPILSGISFGKASYGSDELPLINMSFNVASVQYAHGGGSLGGTPAQEASV